VTKHKHATRRQPGHRLWFGLFGFAAAMVATLWLVNPASRQSAPRSVAPSQHPTTSGDTPYDQTIDLAHRDGMRVWIESDLVKQWLAGSASFHRAIATIAEEATHPGVVGIKIADELGYHDGLTKADQITAFLDASAAALRIAAPGKLLLIDMIIPELGCLPNYQPPLRWATVCAAQQRGAYPQLALSEVDGYLARHDVEAVDVSTGLFPARTYAGWGVDENVAQQAAWQEVIRRGWARLVTLQARKALAHPGVDTESAAAVDVAMHTFIDIPRATGAAAVDVWTWRQLYQGQIYRLPDPGLRDNELWRALVARHDAGAHLFTHLSPHSLEVGLDRDLRELARAFTDLFVAAGTG
jgi:hypothetical protein